MGNVQPHIQCGIQDSAPYAILPGDPQRVDRVKAYLTNPRDIAFNREMKSVVGHYKGVPVMAVSTGMGGASTGIAVEELHNIGVTHMIRVGSSGALQTQLQLGELVIVNGAVRDDGASRAYIKEQYPAIPDTDLLMMMIQTARALNLPHQVGRARSHDSFYTDQEEQIDAFWSSKGILAADMETAALFTIGGLRGVKTASILNIVATFGGDIGGEINAYVSQEKKTAQGEQNEILLALETIKKIDEEEKKHEKG